MSKPYTGQRYQLRSTYVLGLGSYVAINGPHDKFGVVLECEKTPEGDYLNQLRGVPEKFGVKPAYQF